MPPKISFTKEEIIKAALDLIREQGLEKLTARAVARKMGGSTQPLYRVFSTIEELEEDVLKEAQNIAARHMLDYEYENRHFLSIGLGFLDFARKEPELYRLLYLSGRHKFEFDHRSKPSSSIFEKMKKDADLKVLPEESLIKLFRDMSIYSHGLASAGLLKPSGFTFEEYLPLLMDMGMRLIVFEILSHQGIINEELIKRSMSHEHCDS